ncbi:PepSY-associated TM helix domain-containing protein [Imperialibacter roseus]|uniref:PepSY-associated TM helix domain-containing protein n=1 Tax=Imperialibacter roseus TaxID=1324217 RepID=A0ABZ0IQV4_9BACT|nr:PepSY-associated TM helix domain-containing protein [Imperialibacter roseus]WOK07438.1 PepSY-associated TM helix domain-containing protein [Imperialibacter roseus]
MKNKKRKAKNKSAIRRLNDWLHLWLGLTSGVIVLVVSLTGCIYVFQQDIKDALEPWRFVEAQDQPYAPPSQLLDTAQAYMPGAKATGLTYATRKGAAAVGFSSFEEGKRSFTVVFMNPYTAGFLRKQQTIGSGQFDFFRFIIDGHRALWLPYEIGRPIVGVATLVFLVLLVTGLVMWWPKNRKKAEMKKGLTIRWNASFKRVNYDLHNVVGFYSLILALVLGITGLVYSFEWFADGLYYVTSGGESRPEHSHPHSDVSKAGLVQHNDSISPLDRAWYKAVALEPDAQGWYMTPILSDEDDAIELIAYQDDGAFYNHNTYFYDRYTLEPYRTRGDRFVEAGFADQLAMLNYDMHVGVALGLPGKILAFFVSLICASLPVTGFMVWLNKKKKSKKREKIRP